MTLTRRSACAALLALPLGTGQAAADQTKPTRLIAAARARIGITLYYDPAYVRLAYPGGDVPNDRGVCIDVVIRAYRAAFDFDFQTHIHEDMRDHFSAYPKTWGLTRTDRNIDHRRVPNLETWLSRHGHERPLGDWQPGDLLTCRIGDTLPHIGLISDRKDSSGRPLAIHNIGAGTREDDRIWSHARQRRFRFLP